MSLKNVCPNERSPIQRLTYRGCRNSTKLNCFHRSMSSRVYLKYAGAGLDDDDLKRLSRMVSSGCFGRVQAINLKKNRFGLASRIRVVCQQCGGT
mmetsp:Transcript_49727/g.74124  ORF Transcript_49727/g.74124 Transcript_49727/m.74124 type:complete len:95 (+) Transcript_49727:410-694(+)